MLVDRESSIPLYLQIRNLLRSEILEGKYGKKNLPGELELVEQYGVSRGTVRQALRSLEQVGMLKRERGRGTFVIIGARSNIAQDHSPVTVSIIVPHFRDSFVPTLLLGVEAVTRKRGAHLIFNHVESSLELQSKALEEAQRTGVSGIIIFPVDVNYQDPVLVRMIEDHFPVVQVDRYIKGLDLDYVTTDGYGGMLQAVHHLLALGHRRIGFICWDLKHTGQVCRYLGYQQGLRDWGVEPEPDLLCQLQEFPAEVLEPMTAYFTRPDHPTAVITLNDYLAIQVIKVARRLNINIPDDIALVGFDDIDVAAQMDVPLTSVAQPIFEMGSCVAELILNKISGLSKETQRVILPNHLVVRESCGARAYGKRIEFSPRLSHENAAR